MHDSPDPHERTRYDRLTWQKVLASYAMAAAIPVLLWAASGPVAAGVVAATAAFVAVTARRARKLPGASSVARVWSSTCPATSVSPSPGAHLQQCLIRSP